ncbi:hypothetical protein Tco_0586255 [Tanacetum coccineum]
MDVSLMVVTPSMTSALSISFDRNSQLASAAICKNGGVTYKLYNPVIRKVVVSRDVEFDDEESWDWRIEENERYDFLLMTDEEETGESTESLTPTPTQDSPLSLSEGEPKTRSLQELYEVTDEIPLLCLYADCEPLVFEEAMKSKKWSQAMEEEINSIEKNDT